MGAPLTGAKADSLRLSSMGQEVLFCFLSIFTSFLHLGFLMEGISNLMLLSPSCQFCASLARSYTNWEQLFIQSSSHPCMLPSPGKTLLLMAKHLPTHPDRMGSGHLSLSPKNQQDLQFLAAFLPYIFPLKRNKSFINESSIIHDQPLFSRNQRIQGGKHLAFPVAAELIDAILSP